MIDKFVIKIQLYINIIIYTREDMDNLVNVFEHIISDVVFIGDYTSEFIKQDVFDKRKKVLVGVYIAKCFVYEHCVKIFDSNGVLQRQIGSEDTGNGQFYYPEEIIVLINGDIAVLDRGNNRVQIFDPTGIYKSQFGSEGSGNGYFHDPCEIELLSNGDIVILDRLNYRVQIFDSNGIYKSQFGSEGSGNGKFQLPSGMGCN